MKVLILSLENWDETTNGGNVLSNIFQGCPFEFAQIYCSGGMPHNKQCSLYYQISDKMIVDYYLKRKPIGRIIRESIKHSQDSEFEEKHKRKKRLESIFMLREFLWRFAKIDNQQFIDFIQQFKPDVIFAPCYGHVRMLNLLKLVQKYAPVPVISYVSDDLYGYNFFRLSPLYYVRRFNLRRHVRKIMPYYALMYTMTKPQQEQMQQLFQVPTKILRKSCQQSEANILKQPYHMMYAGNLYLNRDKTLLAIAKALQVINEQNVKMVLDIYSASSLENPLLNNQRDTFYHGKVSHDVLMHKYHHCQIALHVESFDPLNSRLTRYSFSTKITECLQSGAMVLAMGPLENAGIAYLKEEDAAIVIENDAQILNKLQRICENPSLIEAYVKKAQDCVIKNHSLEANKEMIIKDFKEIVHVSKGN